jgi:MOSC domain-containing protein YiiM
LPSKVVSVSRSATYGFSKNQAATIRLIEGLCVEGDVHAGITIKHRSRVAHDPGQPNLRQVHLIHTELFDALAAFGHRVLPGQMGENISTRGIDQLGLPRGTLLRIGEDAVIEVTGLRNPCAQIEAFQTGLLAHVVGKHADGSIERKAGIMGIVVAGGVIDRAI